MSKNFNLATTLQNACIFNDLGQVRPLYWHGLKVEKTSKVERREEGTFFTVRILEGVDKGKLYSALEQELEVV